MSTRPTDLHGTLNPAYDPNVSRFAIYVRGYEPDDLPEWQYKLVFVDRKYRDSDGYAIDAIAAGTSWEVAFARASEWVTRALNSDKCIF